MTFRRAECDANKSGGDLGLTVAQARHKSLQRAVLMGAAALDEQRLHLRTGRPKFMDADVIADMRARDHGAWQQRHAHVGGDAADHAVERRGWSSVAP